MPSHTTIKLYSITINDISIYTDNLSSKGVSNGRGGGVMFRVVGNLGKRKFGELEKKEITYLCWILKMVTGLWIIIVDLISPCLWIFSQI